MLIDHEIQKKKAAGESVVQLEANEYPSGFETIGDVAHLNFNDKQFPFRKIVGQVMFDKTPMLRTVVCKLG